MTVGEVQLRSLEDDGLAVGQRDGIHAGDDLGKLAAVGAGIHIDTAAHRARNPVGKLHPGKSVVGRKYRGAAHGDAGHHPDMGLVQSGHAVHAVLETNHNSRHAVIRRQNVGSRSKDSKGCVQFFGLFQGEGQLLRAFGEKHHLGRTTDAKGGMLRHWFVHPEIHSLKKFTCCLL